MFATFLSLLLQAATPDSAFFFGFMGAACALIFCTIGSAYGTAKSGVGVSAIGVNHPGLIMKSSVPVIMAGMIGIYGLIIAVFVGTNISSKAGNYSVFKGFAHLGAGLAVGFSGLAAGMAIGVVGDAGVRANAAAGGNEPSLFVGMILMLVFAEALGLYGLIVALILAVQS
jgi:V-type H+-transporting ATPase proteolipid subunit